MTLIESLPEGELDKLIIEASEGGTELEPTLSFLRSEKLRRGLLLASMADFNDTGVWTGDPTDTPASGIHIDSRWQQVLEDD